MENRYRFWTPDNRMIDDHEGWMEGIGINEALKASKEYGYIAMQYTGLKAIDDKERCEGDIIKRHTGYTFVEQKKFFYLGPPASSAQAYGYDYHPLDEIIGNIYENPELIP